MESDTPNPQNLSPQDPARFSKPKSEPPIIDLEVEKASEGKKTDTASQTAAPRPDTLRIEKKSSSKGMFTGLIGGLIGGGLIALGVLAYDRLSQPLGEKITALSQSLSQKVERDEFSVLQSRLSEIETSLEAAKAEITAISKTSAAPDPQMAKRISALEESMKSVSKNSQGGLSSPDQRGLKLALLLSMRDGLRHNASVKNEMMALEKVGETSPAFRNLQSALATPLLPYDELHSDVLKRIKSLSLPHENPVNPPDTTTRISSFFSQFVTVRPASTVTPKLSATDLSFSPLLDALDQDDAAASLNAIAALPQDEKDIFSSVAAELKRRADVERDITVMIADTLEIIAKGDVP